MQKEDLSMDITFDPYWSSLDNTLQAATWVLMNKNALPSR
jgi:hypothetical protein